MFQLIHHEGVDHQLHPDHTYDKIIWNFKHCLLDLMVEQQITILEVLSSNMVCNSSFFKKFLILQFKVLNLVGVDDQLPHDE